MAAFAISPARSADRLYHFVDEQGVSHFSNVPGDPRYRPLPWTENPAAPQSGLVSVPGARSIPQEVPLAVGSAVPAPEAANSFAEPDADEDLPEDIGSAEMFTDETLTSGVEAEPPGGTVEPQIR
jgi:hypothetical protein